MRKAVELTGKLFESCGLTPWRQYRHHIKTLKTSYLKAQQSKRSTAKNAEEQVRKAHKQYIELSELFLDKVVLSLNNLAKEYHLPLIEAAKIEEIHQYIAHAKRQINQTDRRILQGEKIPHEEKVFSLFEPHTEWINKGKAGVPVELGIKVGIIEDQYQFILHHRVMSKETDGQVAVDMVNKTKKKFPGMNAISYDKGYYSGENRKQLCEILSHVALPKKGKLSIEDKAIQSSGSYQYAKQKHSAVESAINALDVHGLDKCPDHGIHGFERYVAVAIVSRNIQRIGAIIHQRDQKEHEKREQRKRLKLAA